MLIRSRRMPIRRPRKSGARWVVLGAAACFMFLGSSYEMPARAGDAAEFRVIVDPGSAATSATRELIAEAFLKTKTRWPDGEPIRPVDQGPESPARKAFSQGVLKRTVAAVRSYWQQRIFSGREVPPPELDSDDAVVRYVTEHRGAIGYVSASAKTGDTKVVAVQ